VTSYVFVGPGAPATNVRIKAGSYKKAVETFKYKHPKAVGLELQGAGGRKERFVFYRLSTSQADLDSGKNDAG